MKVSLSIPPLVPIRTPFPASALLFFPDASQLAAVPELRERGALLAGKLRVMWKRLDGLFQNVRCVLGLFGQIN